MLHWRNCPGTMLCVLADLVCHKRRMDGGDSDTGTKERRCHPVRE